MTDTNTHPIAKAAGSNADALRNRTRLNSRTLFGAQTEIVIEHQGEEYRLRITSNGKLILTK